MPSTPVTIVTNTVNLVEFKSVFHSAHVQRDAHKGDYSVWIDNKIHSRYIDRNEAIDNACLLCAMEPKDAGKNHSI